MFVRRSAVSRVRVSRDRLFNGISRLALVVPLAFISDAALADDNISRSEMYGLNGRNAEARIFSANTTATPGQDGINMSFVNRYTVGNGNRGVAVQIGSTGGHGGHGSRAASSWEPAGVGGKGGTITLTQNGALAGTGDQSSGVMPSDPYSQTIISSTGAVYNEAPKIDTRWLTSGGVLLLVYSQGGDGGPWKGHGAKGGDAGSVDLTLNSSVAATGKSYAGVWARSLGGNNGWGGTGSNNGRVLDKAGDAGSVTVLLSKKALVSTAGVTAPGVIAESIGGHGSERLAGDDRSAGYGTNGGLGGTVTLYNGGGVSTKGNQSAAILVQSIGGEGGNSWVEYVGRAGGDGGKGGKAVAANAGLISTDGLYSFGLLAQSLGGTGGRGGGDTFVGGAGGTAGAGGEVHAGNFGVIKTAGEGATAMVAQSIGGGSATGAFQVQAIKPGVTNGSGGGAGGSGGWFFFGRGGEGGTGGKGGDVQAVQSGTITTSGKEAYGLLAQSIGGGGGAGGEGNAAFPFIGVALGGRGGGGGDGGDVTIQLATEVSGESSLAIARDWAFLNGSIPSGISPAITTTGKASTGIVAISVGGGGGIGGAASAKSAGVVGSVSVAVGGAGGGGGKGGNVRVSNESAITTSGVDAVGISAQSIGGGGGTAGNAYAYALAVSPPAPPTEKLMLTAVRAAQAVRAGS